MSGAGTLKVAAGGALSVREKVTLSAVGNGTVFFNFAVPLLAAAAHLCVRSFSFRAQCKAA